MFRHIARWTTPFVAMACLLGGVAFAQSTTSVSGVVSDPTGAVVPNTAITLTNLSNEAKREAVTDAAGRYSFPQLQPGLYQLNAKAAGFVAVIVNNLVLQVNQPATVNVTFESVGSVAEVVSVTADATQVNTTDASLGNTIGTKPLIQLPFFARNVVNLLALQPGVTQFNNTTDDRNGAVNGGKSDQANVTLDGIDVNDQQERTAFTAVLRSTLDSVQEFRVTTTNANSDQGRSSGAQIALVTRSGSNDLHGAAYWFHRNDITAANNFFNNTSDVKRPKLLINVFGGRIGGAIVKNRLFYFGNYEGRRDASRENATRTVPSNLLRQGIVQYRTSAGTIEQLSPDQVRAADPGGIGANQAVLQIFNSYPASNDTTLGDGLNFVGYRFTAPIQTTLDTYISRWDYILDRDAKHQLFIRGNLQSDSGLQTPQFPGEPPNGVRLDNSKGYAIGLTSLLTPTLVNNFRYGFTRQGGETTGIQSASAVSFRNLSDRYGLSRGTARIIPLHNIGNDTTWTKGSHEIKFGTNVWLISNQSRSTANSFSAASTNSSWLRGTGADLQTTVPNLNSTFRVAYNDTMMALLGIVSQVNTRYNAADQNASAFLPDGAPIVRNFKAQQFESYVQDTWKVARGLTLTLGLRWSMLPPVYEANGFQTSGVPSPTDWFNKRGELASQGLSQLGAGRIVTHLASSAQGRDLYPMHNQWAPRFGIAYSPKGEDALSKFLFGTSGQTSIRAGFGMYYDMIGMPLIRTADNSLFGFSSLLQNPSGQLTGATAPRFTGLTSIPASLISAPPTLGFPTTFPDALSITNYIDDRLKVPYTMNMNFSIGREFSKGLFVQLSYVGRLSRRSLINRDMAMPTNPIDPASGQSYFEAASALALLSRAGTPVGAVPRLPFWENMFPDAATSSLSASQNIYAEGYDYWAPDYLTALYDLDVFCYPSCSKFGRYTFFSPQYSALSAWSSIGSGAYHAGQLTVRKRFGNQFEADFNYTLGKSMDLASRAENTGSFSGFLVNSWEPGQRRAQSDYDVRHIFNGWGIWNMPFGRGKRFGANMNAFVDQVAGGWQLGGLFNFSSGLPISVGNGRNWPTNWNVTPFATPVSETPSTQTTKNAPAVAGAGGPNLFANPVTALDAYGFTLPGQTGQRNMLRGDGAYTIDLNLAKTFKITETHSLQFRWEVFNVTNSVRFNVNSLTLDLGNTGSFGKYSGTLNRPREMQFGLRYDF